MKGFNKMLDAVMNKGTELAPESPSDTDDTIGNFGNIDSRDVSESPAENKLVLYLDSEVEIHIPVSIYEQMAGAMQPQEPVVSAMVVGDVEGDTEEGKGLGKGPKDGTGPLGGTSLCPNSDTDDVENSDSDDSEEEDKKDKKKEE